MKKAFESSSEEQTRSIARKIGAQLRGGECFEFVSDVGGGKTTFTQGLVAGSGCTDQVTSPTFTISNAYESGPIAIYHYDFYRLDDPGIMREELAEATASNAVIVVEWADTVQSVLPDDRIVVRIGKSPRDPDGRTYEFEYPDQYSYLFEWSSS